MTGVCSFQCLQFDDYRADEAWRANAAIRQQNRVRPAWLRAEAGRRLLGHTEELSRGVASKGEAWQNHIDAFIILRQTAK